MGLGPEYGRVEKPLTDQLVGMGWTHLAGAPPGSVTPTDPAASGRTSFSEVFLTGRLRRQVYLLNRDKHGRRRPRPAWAGHASIISAPGRGHVGNRHRHVW